MRSFFAFFKKDALEQVRTGKLTVILILFALFGVMSPAIAKLTPWLLEAFADTLAESGMTVSAVSVSALDSWMQFFKNAPMVLIAFILIEGGIFTKEYATGTLHLSLSKGLSRHKILLSKSLVLVLLWLLGYFLCFGITFGYTAFFWDNSDAKSLALAVVAWCVFGLFVVSLAVFFSVLTSTSTGVYLGTGGVVLAFYVIGLVPRVSKYLPTYLTSGTSLIYGATAPSSYTAPLIITAVLTALLFALSIPIFTKKQL